MTLSCPEKSNVGSPEANVDIHNPSEVPSSKVTAAPYADETTASNPRYGPWMMVSQKGMN